MLKQLFKISLLTFLPTVIYAGTVRISPVQVDFIDHEKSSSIMLSNESTESNNLQIRIFKWLQDENGIDQYLPTDDIAISPSIVRLKPNGTNNIRFVRLNNDIAVQEQAYRIIIDELPKPVDTRKVSTGLEVLVRSSLPLFITNRNNITNIKAEIISVDHKTYVQVKNVGSRYILLQDMVVTDSLSNKTYRPQISTTNGYILAGKTRKYEITEGLESFQKPQQLHIKFKVNGKDYSF